MHRSREVIGEGRRRTETPRSAAEIVAEADLVARVQAEIQTLLDAIAMKVVEAPFK
jgi:hypothetical protein